MTTVRIFRSADGYRGFESRGHSGYSDAGTDIVCAALSVLTINTVNAIESLAGDRLEVSEEDGSLTCFFMETPSEKAALLMDAMVMGLQSVERNYRQFCKIEIEEV